MTMWTDKREETLKKLWADGLSASQIATQLGGVSRNAVIGKVHRLNLPGRAGTKADGRIRVATASANVPREPHVKKLRRMPSVPNVPPRSSVQSTSSTSGSSAFEKYDETEEPAFRRASDVVVPVSLKLELTALNERTCKWPVGDPLMDDFFFCGHHDESKSPYCTYHQKLAYQPVRERRPGRQPAEPRSFAPAFAE